MKGTGVLWMLLAVMGLVMAFSLTQIANVQHHQNDALHLIMCRAETVVNRTPVSAQFTAKEKRQTERFYVQALSQANLPPCN
jgi:hypothetical protein